MTMLVFDEELAFDSELEMTIANPEGETQTQKCKVEAEPDYAKVFEILNREDTGYARIDYTAQFLPVEDEEPFNKVAIHRDGDVMYMKEFNPVNLKNQLEMTVTIELEIDDDGGLKVASK